MLGYTFRHQLFVYSCHSCLISSFMLLCSYPSVVYLSCYLVIFCLQFICYYSMHIVYMHELSSLHTHTHTLTRSLSDDPGFARLDIGRFVLLCRCSMRLYILQGAWVLLSLILVFSYLPVIPDSTFVAFSCHFLSLIHLLSLC